MKKINFNKVEYSIPETWQEVTLRQVIRFDELNRLVPESPIVALVSSYAGIPMQELKVSKVQGVNKIIEILQFVFTEYKPEMSNGFNFKDQTYECNPDIAEMEFQDWISIQTVLYNYKDNPVLGLPKIIAIIAKQPDEKLDDIDLEARAKLFLDLPFTTAKNLEFFFTRAVMALEVVSRLSLTQKEQEEIILQQFLELDNTMKKRRADPGISWLTRFQIGFWQIYLKYIKRDLEKSFNTKVTKYSKKNFIRTVKNSYTKLAKIND